MDAILQQEAEKLRGKTPSPEQVERLLALAARANGRASIFKKVLAVCTPYQRHREKKHFRWLTDRFVQALTRTPRTPLSAVVVTAADAGYFVGLQALTASVRLSHDCRIVVADLGLTKKQRRWCQCHDATVIQPGKLPTDRSVFQWQVWAKPFLLQHISTLYPGRPLIWLDADTIVTGSLRWIDEAVKHKFTVFAETAATFWNGWEQGCKIVSNVPEMYRWYPTPARFAPGEAPNAGVLAINPARDVDRRLLDTWTGLIRQAAADPRLMDKTSTTHERQGWLSWYDQGALQWSLEKLDLCHLVVGDTRFNDPQTAHGAKSFEELIAKIEGAKGTRVLHFLSGFKPYHFFPKNFDPIIQP